MHFCIRCIDKTGAGGLRRRVRPQHLVIAAVTIALYRVGFIHRPAA